MSKGHEETLDAVVSNRHLQIGKNTVSLSGGCSFSIAFLAYFELESYISELKTVDFY